MKRDPGFEPGPLKASRRRQLAVLRHEEPGKGGAEERGAAGGAVDGERKQAGDSHAGAPALCRDASWLVHGGGRDSDSEESFHRSNSNVKTNGSTE